MTIERKLLFFLVQVLLENHSFLRRFDSSHLITNQQSALIFYYTDGKITYPYVFGIHRAVRPVLFVIIVRLSDANDGYKEMKTDIDSTYQAVHKKSSSLRATKIALIINTENVTLVPAELKTDPRFVFIKIGSVMLKDFADDVFNSIDAVSRAILERHERFSKTQAANEKSASKATFFSAIEQSSFFSSFKKKLPVDTLDILKTAVNDVIDRKYSAKDDNPRHVAKREVLLAAKFFLEASAQEKQTAYGHYLTVKDDLKNAEFDKGGLMGRGNNETKSVIERLDAWLEENNPIDQPHHTLSCS